MSVQSRRCGYLLCKCLWQVMTALNTDLHAYLPSGCWQGPCRAGNKALWTTWAGRNPHVNKGLLYLLPCLLSGSLTVPCTLAERKGGCVRGAGDTRTYRVEWEGFRVTLDLKVLLTLDLMVPLTVAAMPCWKRYRTISRILSILQYKLLL